MTGRVAALLHAALASALLSVALVPMVAAPAPVAVQPVADTSHFDPGNIITDQVFFDGGAMDGPTVQAFLDAKGASCRAGSDGTPCLKDYRQATPDKPADSRCPGAYVGAPDESAADIIAKVGAACGISQRVLLVILQKEQSLVTNTGATLYANRYVKAMGYKCPDAAPCDPQYAGFFNQVYNAAWQFRNYAAKPTSYVHRPGQVNNVRYSPTVSCGASEVFIRNQATAGLYNYTPYQPNAAALAAGYGRGDGCSAYGNRNFWLYFTDWFGSTHSGVDLDRPQGSLDTLTSKTGRITVRGWTFDPNSTSSAVSVHVYIDGRIAAATVADRYRPDVDAAYVGVGDHHGYEVSITAELGQRSVCAYAINIGRGTGNPMLGCQVIDNVDESAPVGSLDDAATTPGVVTVRGWALDPDVRGQSIDVHVYVDGRAAGAVTARTSRPDVAAVHGAGQDAHGFEATFDAPPGQRHVCVYAVNVGPGSTSPLLGCRMLDVVDPALFNPVGSLDSLSAAGGTLYLHGWVYDPDLPSSPSSVHVRVDGDLHATLVADGIRPDVGLAVPQAGERHGFAWSSVLPAGDRRVCVYAINAGVGTTNPNLGCRTVTLVGGAAANPVGVVDELVATGGTVGLRGWAFDPDRPDSPATVHVYVDGVAAAAVEADGERADVGRAYPEAGSRHGFAWSTTMAEGSHRVCAYAINTGAGTTNPLLGCRSVTVSRSPVGEVDDASSPVAGQIAVRGWALDPDEAMTALEVHVHVDGRPVGVLRADVPRPDVAAAVPGAGPRHGYEGTVAAAPGARTVCTYGINVGGGGQTRQLGCRPVVVR